ncbi:MAG: phytanoyl-CoA dioxygenase family protein [Armatimonadetes bacterium]|nr:phytanoyl-CoA dioxygenase family protein [Armatimonadota bacterium]
MDAVDVRKQWDDEGYVLVKGLFSVAETDQIRDHFMEWNASDRKEDFDRIDPTGQDPLAQFPRIIHPHRKDRISLDFLLDERIKTALATFLDEEPFAAQTMFYFKPPGARGQALHQDQHYLRAEPGTCVAAWLAVDACDDDNGCMQVVPRSHRLPLLCHVPADTERSFTSQTIPVPEGYEPVSAVMEAGDVLFFHGNLIHGSGPNASDTRFRRALIAHYVTGDAEQASHFYHPLLRFDGTVVDLADSPEGGQCGVVTEAGIEMVASHMPGPSAPH